MGRRALRQDRSFANLVHDVLKKNVEFEGRCVLRAVHGDVYRGEYTLKDPRAARPVSRIERDDVLAITRGSVAAWVI